MGRKRGKSAAEKRMVEAMRDDESLFQHQPFEVACTKIIYNFSTCKLIEPYVALRAMDECSLFSSSYSVFSDVANVAFEQANAGKEGRGRKNAFMAQIKLFHPHKMCISEWSFFACGVNVFSTRSMSQLFGVTATATATATTAAAVVLSKWKAKY